MAVDAVVVVAAVDVAVAGRDLLFVLLFHFFSFHTSIFVFLFFFNLSHHYPLKSTSQQQHTHIHTHTNVQHSRKYYIMDEIAIYTRKTEDRLQRVGEAVGPRNHCTTTGESPMTG